MAGKKGKSIKKGNTPSALAQTTQSIINGLEHDSSGLPGERDNRFLKETPLTPHAGERIFHAVISAFPPATVAVLQRQEIADAYGKRVKPEQIAADTELAIEALAVAARYARGAERANQIAEAPLVRLFAQAARIVRDADEVLAEHPELADALQPILDFWNATFPGRGPLAKGDAKSTADAKASPDATGATGKLASTGTNPK